MKHYPPIHKFTGRMTGDIYVIEDEDELVLVDTGCSLDYRLIVDRIKSLGRSPVEVGHILLTHYHLDHAGAAAAMRRLSRARVCAHEADAPFIDGSDFVESVYRKGAIGQVVGRVPGVKGAMRRVPPVEVDVPLKDGEVIPILGGVKVLHAPGHTPGEACYYWQDQGVLFTGDAIINTYLFLTLPTEGFSIDFDRAADSARAVVDAMEGQELRMVCAGHGPVVTERPNEKLRRFRGRLIKRNHGGGPESR